jgi:hypothetical protein
VSKFDGTDEPLSYGQALVEIASRMPFGAEAQRAEVVEAIQREHGLYTEPEAPEAEPDPRDAELEQLRAEAAELRTKQAERDREAEAAALRAENERLRAQAMLATTTPGDTPGDVSSTGTPAE